MPRGVDDSTAPPIDDAFLPDIDHYPANNTINTNTTTKIPKQTTGILGLSFGNGSLCGGEHSCWPPLLDDLPGAGARFFSQFVGWGGELGLMYVYTPLP